MQIFRPEGRRTLAEGRIRDFLGELSLTYVKDRVPLEAAVYVTDKRLRLANTFSLVRKGISQGSKWGSNWQSGYFTLSCSLPSAFSGKELAIRVNLGGEILIYDGSGNPLYGLTSCSKHDNLYKKDVHRIGCCSGELVLYAEAAANELFGLERDQKKLSRDIPDVKGRWDGIFHYAEVGVFDEEVWRLYLVVEFLFSLYNSLDPSSTRAVRILTALFNAACAYPVKGAALALASLEPELSKHANASALSTVVVGHAHIDTAWLWPIAETKRKVVRTFSSQIENLKNYPSFKFAASSPQQYVWIKESYPVLYESIKKEVAKGRWEPIGAMWLEPDCILVSGESLVRQIIEGKEFFKNEFGFDVRNCWIPDAFGYPASLPQILKKADVPYFLTQKISWNAHTEFPHDSFIWQGIDGSSVITHFLPEHDYNSNGLPASLIKAEKNFKEKDRLDEFVTALGIGDGGGGPKEEHIERILLASDAEGLPRASFDSVAGFFERLSGNADLLETYRGELYLERHRGTYTTQAHNKKSNREFEEAFRVMEALALDLDVDLKPILHDGLLLQFHDILPGSCIGEVYEESREIYASINGRFKKLFELWLEKNGVLWTAYSASFGSEVRDGSCEKFSIFNFGCSGMQLVKLGENKVYSGVLLDGKYPCEKLGSYYFAYVPLDAGWNTFSLEKGSVLAFSGECVLENSDIKYVFNGCGEIVEIVDKIGGKDFLGGGVGNHFRLYSDNPQRWEAWDIEYYYKESETCELKCVSVEKVSASALKVVLRTEKSVLTEYVYLPSSGTALYFVCSAEWNEFRRLLRVEFPYPALAEYATCDIPYGLYKRKTHVQNEEDFAKFEFCSRGFTYVADDEKGVAVASDCKYGYSASGGYLGLSLLRAPVEPDPFADLGHHEFTYAYIPFEGDSSSVVRSVSDALNSPCLSVLGSSGVAGGLPVGLEGSGVSLSVIKRSSDGSSLVFRAVENSGRHASVVLHSGSVFVECNLLESAVGEKRYKEGDVISFLPFEIKTFRSV